MPPLSYPLPQDWAASIAWQSIPQIDRRRINGALAPLRNVSALTLLGAPRGSFGNDCQDVSNPDLRDQMEATDLGPFRVTGLRPAVAALRAALQEAACLQPRLFERIGLHRMLCARLSRRSSVVISPHAWGLAVDLTLDGQTDPDPDVVLCGLFDLARVLQRHGFYWGAAFTRAEPLHFEISDQLLRRWGRDGRLGPRVDLKIPKGLMLGDRGPSVEALQSDLNRQLPFEIAEDGVFGIVTRAALQDFQRRAGLEPDGIAAAATIRALALAAIR